VLLAEAIVERVPSVDLVRFVSSGTEATMSAIRLARGFTGRSAVVKFAGNYHGHGDLLLAQSGSGVAALGLPGSDGVTEGAVRDTRVEPYNIVPRLDEATACVIVEPVAANMGLVAPVDGFLQGLRDECDRVGALLVFDEVITGFRVGRGGAQGRFGVQPDLTCFGKVIGGGLPVGAYGGRRDVMSRVAPLGPVYQAGTLSGNPVAMAAGLAALELLDDAAYVTLEGIAARLAEGLAKAFDSAGVTARVPVAGALVGLFFGSEVPTDYAGARRTDEQAYARFFHALLEEGVAIAPGAYEILFPGLAHDGPVLDEIVSAAGRAAAAMA
jgi:glutamate-1-semialdehyde 2,1-aminomutase